MSDSWLPLPTHEGSWYMSVDGVSRPVDIIETEDGDGFCILRHEDDERGPKLVEESYIRYYPIPDPPADAGKLPRRFLWKDGIHRGIGVFVPTMPEGAQVLHSWPMWGWHDEQWLSDHADEIEWIDP